MEIIDDAPKVDEKVIAKRQWTACIAAFILFSLACLISIKVFGVGKYSVLGLCIPLLYIGSSSIKNRLSIVRVRGQKGYSTGTRAVIIGAIMIVFAIAYVIIVFTPSLSNRLLPF
jgi:hypothetical protein